MGCRVERQGAVFDERAGASGAPPQQGAQAGGQFVEVEGFDQIVVGAGVEAPDAVADRVAGGDDQYRHRIVALAPEGQRLQPGFPRQADVQQDRVVFGRFRGRLRLAAVTHPVHRVAELL